MFIFLGREGGGAKRNSEGNAEGKRFKENSISLTYNIFLKKKKIKKILKKNKNVDLTQDQFSFIAQLVFFFFFLTHPLDSDLSVDSVIHPWNN